MSRAASAAAVLAALVLAGGCGPRPVAVQGDPSTGADLWVAEGCLTCHPAVAEQWKAPSSHRLLLDCGDCHVATTDRPGPRHERTVSCDTCHSARSHRSIGCVTCHDVHGSANLFLVRPALYGRPVRLTKAEGATPEGLAQGGAGVCETCHATTRVYRPDGGAPHSERYCVECHTHLEGFAP